MKFINSLKSNINRILKGSVDRILLDTYNVGFCISVDESIFTIDEINKISKIGANYNVEYDDMGSFYVYNTLNFENFIREIKQLGLNKMIYLYKGEKPNYEWKSIGQTLI